MFTINHVVLTGRLTSDPDLRLLPSGASSPKPCSSSAAHLPARPTPTVLPPMLRDRCMASQETRRRSWTSPTKRRSPSRPPRADEHLQATQR